eukprot:jgi/Chrzof1/8570/Cz03g15300.t1
MTAAAGALKVLVYVDNGALMPGIFCTSFLRLQGRTCAVRRKLRDVAEFVFVDGPHMLPLWYHSTSAAAQHDQTPEDEVPCQSEDGKPVQGASSFHELQQLETAVQPQSNTCIGRQNAQLQQPQQQQQQQQEAYSLPAVASCHHQQCPPQANDQEQYAQHYNDDDNGFTTIINALNGPTPPPPARPKRAWLVAPDQLPQAATPGANDSSHAAAAAVSWQPAPDCISAGQYETQTEGWDASLQVLMAAVRDLGPFDGVVGFSQGAAVASVLCALQQQQQGQQASAQQSCLQVEPAGTAASEQVTLTFRFAILASGFLSPAEAHQQLMDDQMPLQLPSLHIFGGSGSDRQISMLNSERLLQAFDLSTRHVLRHDSGHIIPSSKSYIAELRAFLCRFL